MNETYRTPKPDIPPTPLSKGGFKSFKLWDFTSFIIIFSIFAALAYAASHMSLPYKIGEPIEISLSVTALPGYAIHTVLRMFIALFFSLLFTFTVAPLAAKSRQAEKFILPMIDILQSVPILGLLSITVIGFIKLFPNSRLGPETAAIFAIFTSQVWNMTLSFFQSIRTVPKELYDAADLFQLSRWQQFWKIEVPHATPILVWNTMVSMSAGWFFVVAAEAISVSNQNILLPGIGSYISVAINQSDLTAITYVILTMLLVIILYDQLLFRPLLCWSQRFQYEAPDESALHTSWFYDLLTKSRWLKITEKAQSHMAEIFLNPPFPTLSSRFTKLPKLKDSPLTTHLWDGILILIVIIAAIILTIFIRKEVTWSEISWVFALGAITTFKVAILTILASLLWIPVGVWIGLNPKMSHFLQPVTQFLAAFPVNLIYPIFVTIIVTYNLNVDIWSSPLMILGTQWYILFNVIAGASSIPKDFKYVANNFGVRKWLWWKRIALPAIFPFYITGAMTAAAGCWNASIVADVLNWGGHKLVATGLGSYITEYTTSGHFPRIALGISVMCIYVTLINRLVWRRLYDFAERRYLG